ncbi:MAG: hypothetical protein Q7W05_04340, partial [Deltaproteobacteria bacterium]|nr:hypothetical protein [Deltaproteobacteria bacterium]
MAQEVLTGNESIEELQKLYDVFTNRIRLIDEKKANTKPEIYQKVRNEYDAKLLELQVLLEEKGAGLEEALNQALAEKEQIIPHLTEVANTLEELELRAVIGEVTEEEKAAQEQVLLAQKAEMENNAAALNEKIQKLNSFVKPKAPQAPAPVPPKPVPAAAPPHPAPKPPAPPAPRPVPAAQPPQPPARPVPPVPPVMQAPPAPVPVAPEPVQELPEALQPPVNEMAELEKQFASILGSSFGETPAQPAPAMEEVMPRAPEPPAFDMTPEFPAALQSPEEPVAEAAPEAPAEEESHEGELKCPKCAAYNRADN